MRISDWSSDVCSSDLVRGAGRTLELEKGGSEPRTLTDRAKREGRAIRYLYGRQARPERRGLPSWRPQGRRDRGGPQATCQTERRHDWPPGTLARCRSEEHTSELQSLMRISYAVF